MLILTRRPNETIVITAGEHTIEFTVLQISGQQIRLGIAAPPQVNIIRKEIAHRFPVPCSK